MRGLIKIRHFADICLRPVSWLAGIFLATSVFFYALNSLLRYFVKSAMPWPEEYCTYIIVLMIFLMQCGLEFREESLAIGVLDNVAKKYRVIEYIRFYFKTVLAIVVFVVLAHTGIGVVKQNLQFGVLSPVLRVPMGIYFALMVATFFLVILFTVLNMISTQKFRGKQKESEVDTYD